MFSSQNPCKSESFNIPAAEYVKLVETIDYVVILWLEASPRLHAKANASTPRVFLRGISTRFPFPGAFQLFQKVLTFKSLLGIFSFTPIRNTIIDMASDGLPNFLVRSRSLSFCPFWRPGYYFDDKVSSSSIYKLLL